MPLITLSITSRNNNLVAILVCFTSSNTAKIFFYGTSITAFQHSDMPIKKQDFSFDFKTDRDDSSPSVLPTSYTLMVPSKAGKFEPPNSTQQKISKSAHVNEW